MEKTLLSLLPDGDKVRVPEYLVTLLLMISMKPDGTLKSLVWITHEAAQGDRVGTRTFDVSEH